MNDNIVLIKSLNLLSRLKLINPKSEDIVNIILEKAGIQSQDMYVILKKTSKKLIATQNLTHTNSIISVEIKKTKSVYIHIICQDIFQKTKIKFIYHMARFLNFVENVA